MKLHIEIIVQDGSTLDQYDSCVECGRDLMPLIKELNAIYNSMEMIGEELYSLQIEELI